VYCRNSRLNLGPKAHGQVDFERLSGFFAISAQRAHRVFIAAGAQ
jgi:hypothetical protein